MYLRRLAPLALLVLALPAVAQTAQPLTAGVAVERDLGADDAHEYLLTLLARQFVAGAADQQTVDVVVRVTGPDGRMVGTYDGPARGPEPFQFEAEEAGEYRVAVTPFENGTGRYGLVVDRIEPVATTPEGIVDQMMASVGDDSPGAIVAVVRDGGVVFQKAYGMANLTHAVPLTPETASNIGSTSKQFTAYAIALLAERGALSLDDDVREYIPELPVLGETVTLRHLLTHTSGYREFLNALAIGGRRLDEGDYIDRGEIIAVVQRQPELQNAPGAEWNYNNTAFALLAEVVARVTDQPFPEWMAENVFAPAGMTRTVVRAHPGDVVPNSAQGYVPADDGGWRAVRDLGSAMGAGGIYATAGDLARWMQTYLEPGDRADIVRQMTTPYVLAGGDTTEYGLGLFVDEVRGLRRIHHGGADAAHRSSFEVFPDVDGGVIVLTNTPAVPVSAGRVAEAFFGDAFEPEEEDPAPASAAFDPADFDPETFDAYAGRYELEAAPGFVLAFRRDGDQYFTQATGQPEAEIVPVSDTTFTLLVVDAQVSFHRDADGAVRSLTLHQNGDHPAQRLDTPDEPAVDLENYAGRYYSEELEAFYTVALEDGALVARNRRLEDVDLTHTKADEFSGGFPLTTVAFEREGDRVVAFVAGSGRARGIRFERVE